MQVHDKILDALGLVAGFRVWGDNEWRQLVQPPIDARLTLSRSGSETIICLQKCTHLVCTLVNQGFFNLLRSSQFYLPCIGPGYHGWTLPCTPDWCCGLIATQSHAQTLNQTHPQYHALESAQGWPQSTPWPLTHAQSHKPVCTDIGKLICRRGNTASSMSANQLFETPCTFAPPSQSPTVRSSESRKLTELNPETRRPTKSVDSRKSQSTTPNRSHLEGL